MIIKAILLMGGEGLRFGGEAPKQFLNLSGKKVYLHTLETFLSCPDFQEILLVSHPQWMQTIEEEITDPRVRIVKGGHTRQDSSYRGLIACGKDTDCVVIHDAVRPLLSKTILEANLNALKKYPAVDTCIPSADTIVHASNSTTIDSIPNRSEYWRGQTPQSFSYPLILEAHEKAKSQNASDDCQLVLELGKPIHIVPGSEDNVKITSLLDLFVAEQLLRMRHHFIPSSSTSLKGKVFAITGGTGGIGSALADLLKKEGATPLIISPSSPDYRADLTHFDQAQTLFENIHETHGLLDGLINCVGYLALKPFHALTPDEIDTFISRNLHSLLYSCRYAHIKKGGHIVNLSSSSFARGRKAYTLYSSAKAAVVNFTQGLADERPDLQVNAIIPQRTNTRLRQTNFPGEDPSTLLSPEEVAEEILLLLKQKQTTGAFFEVRKK